MQAIDNQRKIFFSAPGFMLLWNAIRLGREVQFSKSWNYYPNSGNF